MRSLLLVTVGQRGGCCATVFNLKLKCQQIAGRESEPWSLQWRRCELFKLVFIIRSACAMFNMKGYDYEWWSCSSWHENIIAERSNELVSSPTFKDDDGVAEYSSSLQLWFISYPFTCQACLNSVLGWYLCLQEYCQRHWHATESVYFIRYRLYSCRPQRKVRQPFVRGVCMCHARI
jgi:hypothetical protein